MKLCHVPHILSLVPYRYRLALIGVKIVPFCCETKWDIVTESRNTVGKNTLAIRS